jgi:hypothetical protein
MNKKPKILFWDIETKPIKTWCWRLGKQYVSHDMIVKGEHFDIISIAYKWAGEKKVHALDWGLKTQNSSKMVDKFTKVIEEADVIIAQNGDKFDMKQFNTQRLMHKQDPIAWPTTEDTLKQLRRHFAFPSNSLDYVTKILFNEGKDKMQFSDWVDIVDKKCPKALAKMIKYNKKDVLLLERTFNRISKYVVLKANLHNYGEVNCPHCGHDKSISKGRIYMASTVYQKRKCVKCSKVYKGRRISKEELQGEANG